MRCFSARRPLVFAAVVTLVFSLGLLVWIVTLPSSVTTVEMAWWRLLGLGATRILIPVFFLTVLGWRVRAGFTQRPTRANIIPFLPFLLMPLLPALFGSGFTVSDPRDIGILVVTYVALAFGEEATFRGVVLRALAPTGWMRAAIVSGILFGSVHLVNLAVGNNPGDVGFQVLYTTLLGFAFAATALVTGSIWPLIVIHFAIDFVNAMQQPTSTATTTTSGSVDIASGLINVGLGLIFAGYGYWLLRRHSRDEPITSVARVQ